ncbi:MAG: hypothetical protein COA61_002765 [Zetaproteobacteria bacterium]|nr:hypothetical protein [Zetaproteobacteria bacterium]
MKQVSLYLIAMCMAASTASAASIEGRTASMESQLKGNHGYHAELARELASIASEEKYQHDTDVGKAFMRLAEEHAQKAGGK